MKTWIKALSICILAAGLGACSKKSNKSGTVATTPTTALCANGSYYNQQGQRVDSVTGQICSTTTVNGNSCANYSYNPVTQQYVDASGNPVSCQPINGGLPGTGYNNGQYQTGCDYWNQVYGPQGYYYIPVPVGGQLTCVRSDLLGQYIPGYNQDPWFYNQQQYYTCNWGYDPYCNSNGGGYGGSGGCVNFGGSSWGQQFGVNGQIGLCW